MQRVNILYVITKLELGGAQKQLLSLISHLDKEKYNPFLFTPLELPNKPSKLKSLTGFAAREGLLSEALSINGLTIKRSRFLERRINPLKDLLALIEIYWFIKKNNIKIVHTHSSKSGILGRWAARLAKVEIILHTVHGWSFNDYQPKLCRAFFIWLERLTAHFTDKLIVISYSDKQKGLDNHIGNENKYTVIRYGIDYTEFKKRYQNIREELGINSEDLVVGMVGCFKPQKSPQDFIRLAFLITQSIPNIKFILVGDGILRKPIEKLISRFNLQSRVILTGWRRDIPRILSAMDVFVLTSLWEGLPISVLEAIASLKPVIATRTGGVEEVISEAKTGFLVFPADMNKMAEKTINLLKDENLRKTIAQNAKNSLNSNFGLENMVNSSQGLYENLIRARKVEYFS